MKNSFMNNKKGDAMFSNFIVLLIFLVVAFAGGLIAGVVYYDMNLIESTLQTVNFQIPIQDNITYANSSVQDFQDILGMVVYPILGLKSALPYLTYFMIFAFIIALAITAYVSSKNPVFFVLHLLFTILITYFCIILSNAYVNLMSNVFINQMMTGFTIYNKLMLYLPQIVFFTSLLFGLIAFINLMKPQSNTSVTGLNYGGEY